MKKLSLEEWEKKYIVGLVKPYDQKYEMFVRPFWDTDLQARLQDWTFDRGVIKDKPGFKLKDRALKQACWHGVMLEILNFDKPNLKPPSRALMNMMSHGPGGPGVHGKQEIMKIDDSNIREITRDVKKVATYFGADLVGIAKLDRRWVYSHTFPYVMDSAQVPIGGMKEIPESIVQEIPEEFQYAIVIAFEENYDMLQYFPKIYTAEFGWGYSRMAFASFLLSAFIKGLGFEVIDSTNNDVCIFPPLAMLAGLGEIGRHGLLITPQFGSRQRLAVIITDLPLETDAPIEFGVTEFCDVCKKCARLCPSRSITEGERTPEPRNISNLSGTLKWPIDAETCRKHWTQFDGDCGICMSVCPYSKGNTWPHNLVRWFTDHARWLDPFFIRMDDLFGYGKPRKASNFWEEWQPGRP